MNTHIKRFLTIGVLLVAAAVLMAADPPADTPESLLNSADRTLFEQLPSDIRDAITNEVLTDLDQLGTLTSADKADFLSELVRQEHEAFSDSTVDTSALPGGTCKLSGPYFWYNDHVAIARSSVRCSKQQAGLTSASEIAPHGYPVVGSAQTVHHAKYAWSMASHVTVFRSWWNICGGFSATPEPGYDFADPPTARECNQRHRTGAGPR